MAAPGPLHGKLGRIGVSECAKSSACHVGGRRRPELTRPRGAGGRMDDENGRSLGRHPDVFPRGEGNVDVRRRRRRWRQSARPHDPKSVAIDKAAWFSKPSLVFSSRDANSV